MATSKKYSVQIVQEDNVWTADIVRRVSARSNIVSKSQSGFSSEAEAQAWADTELKGFMANQSERNKRRAKKREG
jgi:hypothetical protein